MSLDEVGDSLHLFGDPTRSPATEALVRRRPVHRGIVDVRVDNLEPIERHIVSVGLKMQARIAGPQPWRGH